MRQDVAEVLAVVAAPAAKMPIVGAGGKEANDTYIEQLSASAEAAVDAVVKLGVASRGHPNILPNLWIASRGVQPWLRLPRGPFEIATSTSHCHGAPPWGRS